MKELADSREGEPSYGGESVFHPFSGFFLPGKKISALLFFTTQWVFPKRKEKKNFLFASHLQLRPLPRLSRDKSSPRDGPEAVWLLGVQVLEGERAPVADTSERRRERIGIQRSHFFAGQLLLSLSQPRPPPSSSSSSSLSSLSSLEPNQLLPGPAPRARLAARAHRGALPGAALRRELCGVREFENWGGLFFLLFKLSLETEKETNQKKNSLFLSLFRFCSFLPPITTNPIPQE